MPKVEEEGIKENLQRKAAKIEGEITGSAKERLGFRFSRDGDLTQKDTVEEESDSETETKPEGIIGVLLLKTMTMLPVLKKWPDHCRRRI